ncbi:MAG: 23S rRNA (guanosine(2251)-2'-O)-methyltransferase RlmB [Clostridiales bacterium]|nr:23S rRNA (guanosine(2251)-2'-O)-methyltransferase RlmB [Clostridiales bacterium]
MNLEQTTENRPAESKKPFKKKPCQGKGHQGKKPFNKVQGEKVVDGKKTSNKAQGEKGGEGEKATNRRPSYNQRPARSKQPKEGVVVDENILFGRNSVLEVLKSGRDIEKILVQKGQMEGSIKKIMGDAKQRGIVVQEVEKTKLDEMCNMEKHQGVVAYVSAHKYVEIDEILNDAKSKGEDPFILILENIQDPHNLGAIIRSAHNAGVHGIIISKRRAVGLTSTVSKASAGAIEYTKVAKVSNIAQTIEELKAKGIWVACADMDGEIIYTDNLRGPIGIVIGSEGEGVSKLVKSKCDFVVRIPMYGKVTSLNASVAASILAYEVVRQRYF